MKSGQGLQHAGVTDEATAARQPSDAKRRCEGGREPDRARAGNDEDCHSD
ncbi:hypothetical protein AB395_00005037 (plasmid) [Sinorhizobium fredii CCBAU 45436]|nr:hypothetical protein AB395_00005037 [Sinorhizobium fredii CCBAU 45436]